jgi:predicted NAD-dependent protein-ADP-ribosyltransferase YbiA (DUF1768 family)
MPGPAIINGEEHEECNEANEDYPFNVGHKSYPSVQHYFFAMKSEDEDYQEKVRLQKKEVIFELGRKCKLRKDWESRKVDFAYEGHYQKFCQNPELSKKLITTGNENIECKWDDNFWIKWKSIILTRIRAELRKEAGDQAVYEKCKGLMDEYREEIKNISNN